MREGEQSIFIQRQENLGSTLASNAVSTKVFITQVVQISKYILNGYSWQFYINSLHPPHETTTLNLAIMSLGDGSGKVNQFPSKVSILALKKEQTFPQDHNFHVATHFHK